MTKEPKYNINDVVWAELACGIKCGTIHEIKTYITASSTRIYYVVNFGGHLMMMPEWTLQLPHKDNVVSNSEWKGARYHRHGCDDW